MPTIQKITGNNGLVIDANSADTHYIIVNGVDIVPADDYTTAIDATQDAANRIIEIAGHVGGYRGVELGNQTNTVAGGRIVVDAAGHVDSTYVGIAAESSHGIIVNHGTVDFAIHAVIAHGSHLSVSNTGTIRGEVSGVEFGGAEATMKNSGTVDGGILGVVMNGGAKQTDVLTNTGVISGITIAVDGGDASDRVFNSGKLYGDVDLNNNDDIYDGKDGIIVGVVDGGGGHDILKGGDEADFLSGGLGNDLLAGRGGADRFIFSTGFNRDEITDFDVVGKGHDRVDLAGMNGFDSFGDLKGHMHQDGADAVLDFGKGDVLRLDNVDFHDLTKGDFLF